MTKQILVVEDDRSLSEILKYNLELSGYKVFVAFDGKQGLEMALTKRPDIVILDVMLPILSGLEVCNRIRNDAEIKDVAIIMLSAKTQEVDQVVGFTMGADDYVAKPFHTEEVLARLRALIRRAAGHASSEIVVGDVRLDTKQSRVTYKDQPVKLTSHEFRLLSYLIHHKGEVVSRTGLIEHLYDQDFDKDSNTIEVFVGRLRKKIYPEIIETVRGLGYRA